MTNKRITILIVEDEQTYRSLLEQTLRDQSFDVVSAGNGEEALNLLANVRVDLILSDVRMPKMDGYAFYQKVQAIPEMQTVPFLFLTAMADKPHVLRGLELGVDDYITKPVDVDSLLAAIRGKLKHASVLRKHVQDDVDRLKSEILRTLTHEFKTPLNIITGVSSFLLNENLSFQPSELSNLLMSIRRGGAQLTRLVDDFIATMSIENGTMQQFYESQQASENILEILSDVIVSNQQFAQDHNVTVSAELADALPVVVIGRAHIQDVLFRLVEYSIASSNQGDTVNVAADAVDGKVTVQVKNPGREITTERLNRVFEKFSSPEGQSTTQYPSSLSLFIAKKLSEINKCELSCVSGVGTGTVFTLTFPR